MNERELSFFCHCATPFTDDGALDEEGLRTHLRRVIDAGNGIFVGSPGAGESASLTLAELRRVYEIGVDEARGKVSVYASTREARDADAMLAVAREAAAAGVDVVQLHQLDGGHGMVPTEAEQEAYFRTLLEAVDHPAAISIHSALGYSAPVSLLGRLCRDYPQIRAVSVVGPPPSYMLAILETLPAAVLVLSGGNSFMHGIALGAGGTQSPYANVVPRTYQRIRAAYLAGDVAETAAALRDYETAAGVLSLLGPGVARQLKLALKILGLGNGVARPPYLPPGEEEVRRLSEALSSSGVHELSAAR